MYRVSHIIVPTLFFAQIGTRILKIDLEIAEIIDVKDGTCHLEVDILLFLRGKKIILVL